MQTATQSILNQATRNPKDKIRVLTCITHESWQSNLAHTNCEFYLLPGPHIKTYWNTSFRPIPSNTHILPSEHIPNYLEFDVVLSQTRFSQYSILAPLAKRMGLNLVTIEHTNSMPFWQPEQKARLREMSGLIDVFISPDTVKEWGWTEENSRVILHGMDGELFHPKEIKNKQPHILSIANDFANRNFLLGFDTWKEVVKDLPVKLYGETEGLSRPAKDVNELISFYQQATCFLSTTVLSPLPSVVLESMCCELPVISTDNNLLSSVINHGVNGFLSNDPRQLREYCKLLLNDDKLADQMGKAARQTILEKFSLSKFVDSWNNVFQEAANTPFRG